MLTTIILLANANDNANADDISLALCTGVPGDHGKK